MNMAVFAGSLAALFGLTAWTAGDTAAAQGDRLSVNSVNVNVRAGPSTNTDVLTTINPGEAIIELAVKGDWFFVEFPNLNRRGWIYGPLLDKVDSAPAQAAAAASPAPAAPAVQTAAAPSTPPDNASNADAAASPSVATAATDGEPAAVKTFRDTVVELNDRAVAVAGINLFTDVRSIGGGGVQVIATETWGSVPEAGQSSYMNALFERWQSMASGLGPLSLQIVDSNGNVMMERSGS